MGQADDPAFAPCLAEIEEALVPALIVEELENGSFTVLVPSVPTPMAGAVYILQPERVHRVDVPFTAALRVFTKWGAGSSGIYADIGIRGIMPSAGLCRMVRRNGTFCP